MSPIELFWTAKKWPIKELLALAWINLPGYSWRDSGPVLPLSLVLLHLFHLFQASDSPQLFLFHFWEIKRALRCIELRIGITTAAELVALSSVLDFPVSQASLKSRFGPQSFSGLVSQAHSSPRLSPPGCSRLPPGHLPIPSSLSSEKLDALSFWPSITPSLLIPSTRHGTLTWNLDLDMKEINFGPFFQRFWPLFVFYIGCSIRNVKTFFCSHGFWTRATLSLKIWVIWVNCPTRVKPAN